MMLVAGKREGERESGGSDHGWPWMAVKREMLRESRV